MAARTCHNCVYSCCDPELWLRLMEAGEPILARCANHPLWPGRLHEVPGLPCRNYRPKPTLPEGDNVRMIALGGGSYAYVDAADYEWLNQWQWHVHCGYAMRYENHKKIYMHRQIMQPGPAMLVDHVDGNRANNCRYNLRVCSSGDNSRNRGKRAGTVSRFKGVSWKRGKWFVKIVRRGILVYWAYFDDEIEAARAYDRKAVELLGEFARLNFPNEWPPERRAAVYAQRQEPDDQGQSDKVKVASKKRKARSGRAKVKSRKGKILARAGTRGRRVGKRRTKGTRRGE